MRDTPDPQRASSTADAYLQLSLAESVSDGGQILKASRNNDFRFPDGFE